MPENFKMARVNSPAIVPRAPPAKPPDTIALGPIGNLYTAPAAAPPAEYSIKDDLPRYVAIAPVKNLKIAYDDYPLT